MNLSTAVAGGACRSTGDARGREALQLFALHYAGVPSSASQWDQDRAAARRMAAWRACFSRLFPRVARLPADIVQVLCV